MSGLEMQSHEKLGPPWVSARKRTLRTLARQLLFSALLCVPLWLLNPLTRLDVFWSDLLLVRQATPMPRSVVLINVTADDVIAHGMERLSRKYLASTLKLLAEAKVRRVLMDFNMSRLSTPEEEAELLAALKLLGPKRIGFAFESSSILRPGERLLAHASVLNLSLGHDPDGRMRFIDASRFDSIPNPCIWLSSGEMSLRESAIDLRYDPSTIRRVSLSELHAGKIPFDELEGSYVVMANDRELSRTRASLPIYGATDRGTVLAMATASSLANYSAISQQNMKFLAIASAVITLVSLYVGYRTTHISEIFVNFFRLISLVMLVSWWGTHVGGVPTKPASMALTSFLVVSVAIADRLRVFELFKGLFSGVLSPEEVWYWRSFGDRHSPVILFDAMGYIKKANQPALLAFNLDPKTLGHEVSSLAKQCMPSLGERCVRLITEEKEQKIWDVEWPSKHLPIAIFTDVTSQHQELEALHRQLMTDPLTGVLNRRGFEAALDSIERCRDRDYAVFFLDMNGFKAVNDQYGHGAGDLLLKETSQRFLDAVSPQDQVARFGGDEFAILVPRRLSLDEAQAFRDRIESTLAEKIDVGEARVQVGVAAGFAIPIDETEPRELVLERADNEMYRRKNFLKHLEDADDYRPATTPCDPVLRG